MNTIRIPKTLGKLNDKLPASQYESDYIKQKKIFQGLSFPNKVLPVLKVRYNQNDNNYNLEKEKENKTIEINPPTLLNNKEINKNKRGKIEENLFLKNGKKNNSIEKVNKFKGYNNFKTLKMMIDKEKPFNYKGQIDIIVEE